MMTKPWWKIALVTVPAIMITGSAMGWLSNSGFGNDWFDALVKPSFMPPGWLFGLVWPLLYAMLGIAVAMILAMPKSAPRRDALILFWVQLALNFSWSPLFFAAHQMRLAGAVIVIMLLLAAMAAGKFFRLKPLAGALMIPYLGWLLFASVLNWTIVRMNDEAGGGLLQLVGG